MNNLKIYLSILLFLSSCGSNISTEELTSQENSQTSLSLSEVQAKNAELELGKIEQKNISQLLKVNGKIELPPQSMISISVPLGGYLKSTKLLPGMRIKKGEVIAVLEDMQYIQLQQDYLSMKENLHFTEKEFIRQKELNQSKASSDKVFEQIEMEFQNQKIALKSLSEKLLLLNIQPSSLSENRLNKGIAIYSPVNGYVSKVNANIGKYVNSSDALFELIDIKNLYLNLKVFEKDLDKVFIGQSILAYNNAQPDKKFEGKVVLIGRDLADDGSIEVYCHFNRLDNSLIPGMYMNAEIEVHLANVAALPEDAVLYFEGRNYVFISKGNNQFELLEVELGNKENNFVQVLNHEAVGDQDIVTIGAYALLMKMKNITDE